MTQPEELELAKKITAKKASDSSYSQLLPQIDAYHEASATRIQGETIDPNLNDFAGSRVLGSPNKIKESSRGILLSGKDIRPQNSAAKASQI